MREGSEPRLDIAERPGIKAWLCLALCLALPANAAPADLAITGATLVDVTHSGHSARDLSDATILVRDGVILAIGKRGSVVVPRSAKIIDARGQYAVPGLIDGFGAIRNQAFADAYLYEGVTSVQVVHAPPGKDGEETVVTPEQGPRLLPGVTIGGTSPEGLLPATHPWSRDPQFDHPLSNAQLTAEVDSAADRGVRGLMIAMDVRPFQLTAILTAARRRHLAMMGELALTTYSEAIDAGIATLVRNDHYLTSLATADDLKAYSDDPQGPSAGPAYRAVCRTEPGAPALDALRGDLLRRSTTLMPILAIEATADDVGAPNPWLSPAAIFVTPGDLDDPVDPLTGARPYLSAHPDRREALQACARRRQGADRYLHAQGVTPTLPVAARPPTAYFLATASIKNCAYYK